MIRRFLPVPGYFIGRTLPGDPTVEIKELIASGNNALLFRAWSARLNRAVACKVIPRSNLQVGSNGEPLWEAEVRRANGLRNRAVVKFSDIRDWVDDSHDINCVVLTAEYVDGSDLRQFLRKRPEDVTVPFVREFLETMLNLFHEMQLSGVVHGDLHLGNILVEDATYNLRGQKYEFRVTDFGVAETTSDRRFKDDYLQLADAVRALVETIDVPSLDARQRHMRDAIAHQFVARHLVESDTTRDPIARVPEALLRRLSAIDREFGVAGSPKQTLLTPFDFLSCEHLGGDDALLQALYSEKFLGTAELQARNNVVVTGPRGCGKSTVFRSLSLEHRISVGNAAAATVSYIGIYYRCDHLYFAFPRYSMPSREDAVDTPVHFLTATLLELLFSVVEEWGREAFAAEFQQTEEAAAAALWDALGLDAPRVPGALRFQALIARMATERNKAKDRHRFASDESRAIGRNFGVDALALSCAALRKHLWWLGDRPIYFFVDDYSSPKVSADLQRNLNRVLFQRHADCYFKISTESPVSFEASDIDGKSFVETREYSMLNLGLTYLNAELKPKLLFVEDVFRRRLAGAHRGWPSELEQLLGTNAHQNYNAQARDIVDQRTPKHWGMETLCELCTGDIHYLISVTSDMATLAGGEASIRASSEVPRIPIDAQNQAIREGAGRFLQNLRRVPKCGPELAQIVETFGNVAYSHLRFLKSKNESGAPPKQASRIEPYEPLQLSAHASELYSELLRYSVFIEDSRGKSRRGALVPRLLLRRFLIPHFNLTFSRRDSIELEQREFESFLVDPTKFDREFRLKNADDADRFERRRSVDPRQFGLDLGAQP